MPLKLSNKLFRNLSRFSAESVNRGGVWIAVKPKLEDPHHTSN